MKPEEMIIGGRYNWVNQPERLVYVGMCEPRNGRWHQFELVDKPGKVWCEVQPGDLAMFEETIAPRAGRVKISPDWPADAPHVFPHSAGKRIAQWKTERAKR